MFKRRKNSQNNYVAKSKRRKKFLYGTEMKNEHKTR